MQKDIGILAAEIYFPKSYIAQTVLETKFECPGKYTKGLGQLSMAICDEAEDVVSMSLTVTKRLIERFGLNLKNIGFLEVGSETLIDKSKAIKTHLMDLFEDSGNLDLAGIDLKSACYGGTAALFNAVNWLESSYCDGRLALVVAADIAIYSTPSTQPTGGAGAVAILLGPNAPLAFDSGLRVCTMRNRYDFYKPLMKSIFPEVDGKLSIYCYREAVLTCYRRFKEKVEKLTGHRVRVIGDRNPSEFSIDYVCFHSPFYRLVTKSFSRMVLQDVKQALSGSETNNNAVNGTQVECSTSEKTVIEQLTPFANEADSIEINREVEEACLSASRELFETKVAPSLRIASQVGNMYTASLFSCLISLLCSIPQEQLRGRRVLMFSYGSGYTASMFSLRIAETAEMESIVGASSQSPFDKLAQRTSMSYDEFSANLQAREAAVDKAPLEYSKENLRKRFFPGTYYLTHIDEKYRRFYQQTPKPMENL
nr:hydroxymethylglutaryl coenzyme A synthase [Hymenolepis microstoma]